MSVRSCSRQNDTWPREWPGVGNQRQPASGGRVPSLGQRFEPPAHVDWAARKQRGRKSHQPSTYRRVRRRVSFAAIQVRVLQRVGVDWHIPLSAQFFQGSHVVKMTMGKEYGGWARMRAKSLDSRTVDECLGAHETGVDQNPFAILRPRWAYKDNVDDREPAISQVRPDFQRPIVTLTVAFSIIGTSTLV